MSALPAPRRVAVAWHPQMPEAEALGREIAAALSGRGLDTCHGPLTDEALRARVAGGGSDLLVVLGGDGTMLRAGHLGAPGGVPIFGINVGHFGFLIEVSPREWQPALERVLAGDCWVERRMMLLAAHDRAAACLGEWDVLHECVIGRSAMVRPVRLVTEIDGHYLTTYVADALIVATPTGSTAYALAAGGPILPPELRNILIIAVAPHLSVDRALVLHEGSHVRVTVHTDHQASLSVDGQTPVPLEDGDQVAVRAGPHAALFVRLSGRGYFYPNITSRLNHNPSAREAP